MLSCWFSGQFIHVYPTGTSFLKNAGAANASMERIERIDNSFPTPTHLHTTAQRHATSMWDALSFCLPASSKIISKGHPQCHCSRFSSSSKQDLYMDPMWINSDQQKVIKHQHLKRQNPRGLRSSAFFLPACEKWRQIITPTPSVVCGYKLSSIKLHQAAYWKAAKRI